MSIDKNLRRLRREVHYYLDSLWLFSSSRKTSRTALYRWLAIQMNMDLYKTHNEDIFYSKYTRKKMINWLNEIIKNPKLLLPKTIVDTKSISTDKDSINFKLDDNIDIMELQRQLMKQQQEDSFNSIIDYLK